MKPVSRLVVFALGALFGAIALHQLAPRVRGAWDRLGATAPVVPAATTVALDPPPAVLADDKPMAPATVKGEPVPSGSHANSAAALARLAAETAARTATLASTEPATATSNAAETVAPTPTPEPAPPPPADVAKTLPADVVEVPPDIPTGLLIPVQGVEADALIDTFTEARGGGTRPHDAIDIMAPAGTAVRAVADGKIAKLFLSDGGGGITIYQFDPGGKLAYYYAHLERYADGLAEGQEVKRGDVIGYVGSTGNANPAAPHLHFAIMVLGPEKRWWEGSAINPYPILVGATEDEDEDADGAVVANATR